MKKSNTPVEFTNLFVSLARTAGVPARAIVGFGGIFT